MDDELKKKAYLEAMRLKSAGLDNEIIYARLEKQGISPELIDRVLKNMDLQSARNKFIEQREYHVAHSNARLIKAGVGLVLAVISYFLFPDQLIVSVCCMLSGLAYAIFYRSKT